MLSDIFGMELISVSRIAGYQRLHGPGRPAWNAEWDESRCCWRVPEIIVRIVGHFLTADFARIFGRVYYDSLFQQSTLAPNIDLSYHRRLSFIANGQRFPDYRPVVEFAEAWDGRLYAVRVETADTSLPYGSGQLDRLARTFLGVSKSEVFNEEQKSRMRAMFRERPHEAFGYALRDAALTLLLFEQMTTRNREIYRSLNIPEPLIGPMKPTAGARVADRFICGVSGALPRTHTCYRMSGTEGPHARGRDRPFSKGPRRVSVRGADRLRPRRPHV